MAGLAPKLLRARLGSNNQDRKGIKLKKFSAIAPVLLALGSGCHAPNAGHAAPAHDSAHGGSGPVLDLTTRYYESGYLEEESVERLRDAQGLIQATAAYEFAIPIAGYAAWWKGFRAEAEYGDWVLYDNYEQKAPILTSNITTPYTVTYVDLSESPYYIEIPPGRIGGLVLDIYQRPQADLGVLGPDQGRGGTYLLVGPGQQSPAGHTADYVIQSNCNLVFVGTRIIGEDAEGTDRLRRQHFVYRVGGDKSAQRWIEAGESPSWMGHPARGIQFWKDIHAVLRGEPIDAIPTNRTILTLLRHSEVYRSRDFQPGEESARVLEESAIVGDAIAMVNTFSKRSYKSKHWPDRNWRYILNQTQLDLMHPDYYEAKEIGSYTYEAFSTSRGMVAPTRNQGSKYLGIYLDDQESWLDGGNTYVVTMPPGAPAADFWSFVVYSNTTRTPVLNSSKKGSVGSLEELREEPDGSHKVFFGPHPPGGYEKNWVETNPGEGFFLYFRLYGPMEAFYDKSWKMSDPTRIN